jgi:hypothetical protein
LPLTGILALGFIPFSSVRIYSETNVSGQHGRRLFKNAHQAT